jgi:aminopeptidase-like protein
MSIYFNDDSRKKRMIDLLTEIFPLQRMITSDGLDEAFKIVQREFPDIVIHNYPVGTKCGDWVVPKSWEVMEGWIEDDKGNRILSIQDNILFVASYSEPIDGFFSKNEIKVHLSTNPNRPTDFILEHRNAFNYHLKTWGISIPFSIWEKMPDAKYHIKIRVKWGKNSLKVADYHLPGSKADTIILIAHIDELCNDDLSGCVVIMEIMRYLQTLKTRIYSYKMLLVPETIGTFFYIKNNPNIIATTIGVIDFETNGAGEFLCLKKAHTKDSYIEKAYSKAITDLSIPIQDVDFFFGSGNDERVFEWPTIKIPSISLQRWPFKEYHTSSDIPKLINSNYLLEAVNITEHFVALIEKDKIPFFNNLIPPWLSYHRLYYDYGDKNNSDIAYKINNTVFYNIDGEKSILELARISNIPFNDLYEYLIKLQVKKIITLKDIQHFS